MPNPATGPTPYPESDPAQLPAANAELPARLVEAEETLRAIRTGEVDTVGVHGKSAAPIFKWQGMTAGSNPFPGDILDQISDAVVLVDQQQHVTYFNAAAERQYGLAAADALGLRVSELRAVRWSNPQDEAAATQALTETGRWRGKSMHVLRSGSVIHVESAVTRLCDASGEPAGTLSTLRDITVRPGMEVALRQNEALFSSLIEQAPGAVFVLDSGMRFRQLNPQTAAVFSNRGELIGRHFGGVLESMWGPDVAAAIMQRFAHTLATGERYVSPDFYHRRADSGAEESYEWEIQRLDFPNGESGIVCYFTDVTEDRVLVEALRRSQERFDIVREGAQVGFWFSDLPFSDLIWDDLVKEHFWLAPDDAVTIDTFYERLHPDDRGRTRQAIEESIACKTRYDIEYRTVSPEGAGEKWIRAIGRTFYDSGDQPIRFDGVTLDITARLQAEMNARFLADVSQDLIAHSDVPGIMESIGARLSAHLGLSLVNFVDVNESGNAVTVTHAWHRPEVPSSLGTYRLADYLAEEYQVTLRAGEPFVVRDTSKDPRTNAERFAALGIGAFVSTPLVREGLWQFMVSVHHSKPHDWTAEEIELTREVTVRLWTRLERVRFEAALHESEARKEAILTSALDAIITMDHEGRVLEFNPAAERIFGYPRARVLGKIFAEVIIPERLRERHTQGLKHYLATNGDPVLNKLIELPALRADGTEFPAELAIIDIPGAKPPVFTAFLRDVTERKRMQDSLHARAAELVQADRSKDEFLAMLAHELRNPLAPLRNATEILQITATPEQRSQALRIMSRQIDNMSRMIDDLLDVSRITEGKIELKKTPVLLEAVLTSAASLMRGMCREQNQTLTLTLPPEPVWLPADATRLEQVFGNLLINASKYGGPDCHISITAELPPPDKSSAPTRAVIVKIADDGAGIDPELLPVIFGLFVQASRTLDRHHGGLGIGLTLVQRLVHLHGGSVQAHSAGLGHGATFTLRLPILAEPPPPAAPAPREVTPSRKPRRILIVDDNKDAVHTLATLLGRRGHTIHTAFTGPGAVTAAGEFLPEAVLLDIGLPGMDGFEVARRLRALPALQHILLIAMSGYGRPEDHEEATAAGFNHYLVKPIDLVQLRHWLDTMGQE